MRFAPRAKVSDDKNMETKITESLPQLEEELELIIAYLDSDNPEERVVGEEIFNNFITPFRK